MPLFSELKVKPPEKRLMRFAESNVAPEPRASGPRHGFAVVVALTLMAFLVLLLVGLSTLLRVEVQSAKLGLVREQARANALLGVQAALAQLQEAAGPDQRVTARADILANRISIAENPTRNDSNHFWTGVWKTANPDDPAMDGLALDNWSRNTADPAATVLDVSGHWQNGPLWLISSNQTPRPDTDIGTLNTVDGEVLIAQVLEAGSGSTPADRAVYVGRIPLATTQARTGHYGYWVADEGLKTPATGSVPDFPALPQDERLDLFRAPPNTGLALLPGISTAEQADKLQSLQSREEVDIILARADASRELFHDYTTHSKGLLTNVRDGGLKKDLTHAMTHTAVFEREFTDPAYYDPAKLARHRMPTSATP